MGFRFNYLMWLLSFLPQTSAEGDDCRRAETKQSLWRQLIPSNYSPMEPPVKPHHVFSSLQILDVDEINEAEMYFQIQLHLINVWTDPRLDCKILNDTMSYAKPNNRRVLLPDSAFHCFWSPSIIFDNSKGGKLFQFSSPNTMIVIYHNHTVVQASRYALKIRCRMDLSTYPMDEQKCQFRVRLLDDPNHVVQLHWVSDDMNPVRGMISKDITSSKKIHPISYNLNGEVTPHLMTRLWLNYNYTYLCANFTFTRRLTSSLLTFYIPSSLTVITSWVSFWIDPEAVPGRISLGIMAVLTIMTLILDVRKVLPPVNYVTAIDVWLFVCLVLVFLSLVEFAFSYTFVRKQKLRREPAAAPLGPTPNSHQMERPKERETPIALQRSRFVRIPSQAEIHMTIKSLLTAFQAHSLSLSASKYAVNDSPFDNFSQRLFPFAFLTFSSIYWAYYLNVASVNFVDND